jgi:hypothetical protein
MHEEYRARLATEFKYALSKMQEANEFSKKLYYFSVFFGEAQRVLNFEWDSDLALIYTLTQNAHAQINGALQAPGILQTIPCDLTAINVKLVEVSSKLVSYFEMEEKKATKDKLLEISRGLAEIAYAVNGNGCYLIEKGSFVF